MGTSRIRGGRLGLGLLAATLAALTGCASAIAGTGTTSGRPGEPPCVAAAAAPRVPTDVADPALTEPVIAVDAGTNMWIANGHTAPLFLSVYADGTAIRSEGTGGYGEPLPTLTIGHIDRCVLDEAVADIRELADADMGDPAISDQGTTSVSLSAPSGAEPITVSAYALGIGDEYVEPTQGRARARLSGTIDGLAAAMTGERPWTPDRVRVSWFHRAAGPDSTLDILDWPLESGIATHFDTTSDRPFACTELSGADAAAVLAAVTAGQTLSTWNDGDVIAALAIGVLMPGQDACPEA